MSDPLISAPPKIGRAKPFSHGHNAGQRGNCLLYGVDTAGALSLSASVLEPDSHAPLHVHSREDETFYVITGEVEALVGNEREVLHAGDCIFLPRGIPHRLLNTGAGPAQLLLLIHPPGLERFFDEVDQLASSGPTSPEVLRETAARYGVTILD